MTTDISFPNQLINYWLLYTKEGWWGWELYDDWRWHWMSFCFFLVAFRSKLLYQSVVLNCFFCSPRSSISRENLLPITLLKYRNRITNCIELINVILLLFHNFSAFGLRYTRKNVVDWLENCCFFKMGWVRLHDDNLGITLLLTKFTSYQESVNSVSNWLIKQ